MGYEQSAHVAKGTADSWPPCPVSSPRPGHPDTKAVGRSLSAGADSPVGKEGDIRASLEVARALTCGRKHFVNYKL